MAMARNEVTQEDRASLYELYIPLTALVDLTSAKLTEQSQQFTDRVPALGLLPHQPLMSLKMVSSSGDR